MSKGQEEFDLFVSYASEDRAVVAQLVEVLSGLGIRVWFDRSHLKVGDSLRKKIDEGLSRCRFGAVVLSSSFFGKHYPERELAGLAQRELDGQKVLLPVWHRVDAATVRRYSPPLADRVAANMDDGLFSVAAKLMEVVRPDIIDEFKKNSPMVDLPRITKGSEISSVIRSSHFSMVYNDEVENEKEADLVGGFIQELRDWGDIWDDVRAPDHLRNEVHLTERIGELEEAGWSLHAKRERRRLKLHGVDDEWEIADIALVRGLPRAVCRSGAQIFVLREG